jgi:superfamily II DNA helicase RecQ
MKEYCEMRTECRRKVFAHYFGDSKGSFKPCGDMCDNCLRKSGMLRQVKPQVQGAGLDNLPQRGNSMPPGRAIGLTYCDDLSLNPATFVRASQYKYVGRSSKLSVRPHQHL